MQQSSQDQREKQTIWPKEEDEAWGSASGHWDRNTTSPYQKLPSSGTLLGPWESGFSWKGIDKWSKEVPSSSIFIPEEQRPMHFLRLWARYIVWVSGDLLLQGLANSGQVITFKLYLENVMVFKSSKNSGWIVISDFRLDVTNCQKGPKTWIYWMAFSLLAQCPAVSEGVTANRDRKQEMGMRREKCKTWRMERWGKEPWGQLWCLHFNNLVFHQPQIP